LTEFQIHFARSDW